MQPALDHFESIEQICADFETKAPAVLLNTSSAYYARFIQLHSLLDRVGLVNGMNSTNFLPMNELRYNLSALKEKISPIADPKLEGIVDRINRLIRLPSLPAEVMLEVVKYLESDHRTLAVISSASKHLNKSLREILFQSIIRTNPLRYYFRREGDNYGLELHLNMWNIKLPEENRLRMADIEQFTRRCPTLNFVSLQTHDISALPIGLERWRCLKTLKLGHYIEITSEDLKKISVLTNLRILSIDNCQKLEKQSFQLLSALISLQSLKLSGCFKLPSSNLRYLTNLLSLQQLELNGLKNLTNSDFQALAYLTNLSALTLPHCRKLKAEGMESLTGLSRLQILEFSCDPTENLAGNHKRRDGQLTDGALVHIGRLTNLCTLRLYKCQKFSAEGLHYLSRLEQLESLIIKNYDCLTDLSVRHLRALTNLKILDLSQSFGKRSCKEMLKTQSLLNFTGLVYLEGLAKLQHLFVADYAKDYVEGFSATRELMLERLTRIIPALSIVKVKFLS